MCWDLHAVYRYIEVKFGVWYFHWYVSIRVLVISLSTRFPFDRLSNPSFPHLRLLLDWNMSNQWDLNRTSLLTLIQFTKGPARRWEKDTEVIAVTEIKKLLRPGLHLENTFDAVHCKRQVNIIEFDPPLMVVNHAVAKFNVLYQF